MKTVSINNYYSRAYLENAKNQQISTHSIVSSIFTTLLSIARNLLFANYGQIKNLNINTSSIPSFIGSEKSYQEKFNFTCKEKELDASKAIDEIVLPYKPISIPFRPIKNTQTTYNIMNLFNPFTNNKRTL